MKSRQPSTVWVRWCLVVDGRPRYRVGLELPSDTQVDDVVTYDGRPYVVTRAFYRENRLSTLHLASMGMA